MLPGVWDMDPARGWVLRTVLLCFTVHLQLSLRLIQGYVFSSARSREGFSQGTSRSIHVLSLEQIMRHRTLYADHSSGLHENQGKSWTVVCLVCRHVAEKASTQLLVQLAFFKYMAQFRECEQRGRCLAISAGIILNNKIINKNYFLYWGQGAKPHCHLSLLALSHKRLLPVTTGWQIVQGDIIWVQMVPPTAKSVVLAYFVVVLFLDL